MTEPVEARHAKSTSLAEYFRVGVVTVRQSNRNGVICCLTCLTTRCKHITAALPAIELAALASQTEPTTGALSAGEDAA
jgi:hypothetical protein